MKIPSMNTVRTSMLSILSSRSLKDESCSLEIFSVNNGERIAGILILWPSFLFLDNCIECDSANSHMISVSQVLLWEGKLSEKNCFNSKHLEEWNHYPNSLQESTSDTVMVVWCRLENRYIEDVISFNVLTEDLCTIIFERMKLSTETCALYLFCK